MYVRRLLNPLKLKAKICVNCMRFHNVHEIIKNKQKQPLSLKNKCKELREWGSDFTIFTFSHLILE